MGVSRYQGDFKLGPEGEGAAWTECWPREQESLSSSSAPPVIPASIATCLREAVPSYLLAPGHKLFTSEPPCQSSGDCLELYCAW